MTVLFFAIALGLTLALQAPPWLAQRGVLAGPFERFMPLAALGAFSPLVAALIASRLERERPGVRALFRPVPRGSVGARWYLFALVIFPAIYIAGLALHAVFAGLPSRVLYLPESNQHVAAMVLMPLVEEPGWRGFALPRLQQRYSRLSASLLLGALWALWHTFMFLVAGIAPTPAMFALLCANIVAGSLVFSWLYNRTNGSLLIAVLAHVGVHINNPTHALPANATPFAVYTAAIAAFGIGTIACDRDAWGVAPMPLQWSSERP